MNVDTYITLSSDFTPAVVPMVESPAAMVTTTVIAQQFEDTLFDRSGEILGDFVESGQLWALLIGVVLGYFIRGITTY